ncbi:hypothetical protein [Aeromonas hydrophila]|uniref:hypothetical protein n=1 Tax=Aeromonas hydrophila TaxID=644 RepID=UPI0024414333|nr:hypothetical protein [Aeromonas hydrophila]
MFELIEKAMAHLQSGNYAILIAVIIASLIYKSLPLLDAYHTHRKRRVTDLENTIKSDNISSSFKKNLKEEIESEHFKIVYGVRAKKSLIDQVFMLHNKLGGERTLHQFANALKLYPKVIRGSDGKYKLDVGLIDFFFGLYHLFFWLYFLGARVARIIYPNRPGFVCSEWTTINSNSYHDYWRHIHVLCGHSSIILESHKPGA